MSRAVVCDRCKEEVESGVVFDLNSFVPELFSLKCLCEECAREIEDVFEEDDYSMKEETIDEYLEEERYAYQESQWEMDMER